MMAITKKPVTPATTLTVEDLLDQAGGFGLFQFITTFLLYFNKFMTGWSMFQMTFAGIVPSWTCEGPPGTDPTNWTVKSCEVASNTSGQEVDCQAYDFIGPRHTAISEWHLVCDLEWVKRAMTSIQMAGLLIGALIAGQMGDVLGRRKTTYLFVLEHSVLNILASFAGSWQVFAACRFFIGFGVGGILVVAFTLGMEFLPTRWRAVCACLPVWAMGVSVFALTAWQLEDWSTLHLVCGACGLPAVLGYFYVPESLRWLTVKGKLEEAEHVVARIAKTNGKPVPPMTSEVLKAVALREQKIRENEAHYTYLDIFRDRTTAKITTIFCFEWFSFSLIFYGISFGISALAGNIYLNIFLMDALVVPFLIMVFFTQNIFGRKMTAFPLLAISCAAAIACLVLQTLESREDYGQLITALSLTAKTGIGAGWAVFQTWGTEIYPTVTRNLGYGAANTAARVGGIIAPYVIDFDNYMIVAYVVISVLLFIDTFILLALPETNGRVLEDSLAPSPGYSSSSSPTNHDFSQERKHTGDTEIGVSSKQGADHLKVRAVETPVKAGGDGCVDLTEEIAKVKPDKAPVENYGSTAQLVSGIPGGYGEFPQTLDANDGRVNGTFRGNLSSGEPINADFEPSHDGAGFDTRL